MRTEFRICLSDFSPTKASHYLCFTELRMGFKNGQKAQKLLAQGIALGMMAISKALCKGKSLMFLPGVLKLLPFQGDRFASVITQGAALG